MDKKEQLNFLFVFWSRGTIIYFKGRYKIVVVNYIQLRKQKLFVIAKRRVP